MRTWLRKSWPVLKALFVIAIVVAIGRQFVRDLQYPELWKRSLHPGWLVLSGVLYLLGLGFSALYWYRLLWSLGQEPPAWPMVRAYYIGHMGKYLPGKAWALFLRANLARVAGVRVGVAVLTSFYEVLTTMAAGVLLAALLFALAPPTSAPVDWHALGSLLRMQAPERGGVLDERVLIGLALLLLVPIGGPILPPIFNRIVHRIALPFREADAAPPPRIRWGSALEGLGLTAVGWLLLGASLWAVLQAVLVEPPPFTWENWRRYTAFLAVSYVAGFIVILIPNGFIIREFFLALCLFPEMSLQPGAEEEAQRVAKLAAVLLRLVWTAAELVLVGIVYRLPSANKTRLAANRR
jgi:hypothetical protein